MYPRLTWISSHIFVSRQIFQGYAWQASRVGHSWRQHFTAAAPFRLLHSDERLEATDQVLPSGGDVPLGTRRDFPRFDGMRIREEDCNMVLLAAVTLVSMGIAGGVTLFGATEKPTRYIDHSAAYAAPAPSHDRHQKDADDQPLVRVVGAPFVPNTNPRER
jgi:hypothetical protein